jgi:hypothetical protein
LLKVNNTCFTAAAPTTTLDLLALKYTWLNMSHGKTANVNMEMLRRTIMRLKEINPSFTELVLHFDNANKKNWTLRLAVMLVQAGVVDSVRLFTLVVGHTHSFVDRIFFQKISRAVR